MIVAKRKVICTSDCALLVLVQWCIPFILDAVLTIIWQVELQTLCCIELQFNSINSFKCSSKFCDTVPCMDMQVELRREAEQKENEGITINSEMGE